MTTSNRYTNAFPWFTNQMEIQKVCLTAIKHGDEGSGQATVFWFCAKHIFMLFGMFQVKKIVSKSD